MNYFLKNRNKKITWLQGVFFEMLLILHLTPKQLSSVICMKYKDLKLILYEQKQSINAEAFLEIDSLEIFSDKVMNELKKYVE